MGAVLLASVLLGVPLGIGLGIVAVRVMPLFFLLPPPLATVPWRPLLAISGPVVLTGAVLTLAALRSALRSEPARLLRG
jgi:putative ABC transport system permease protein